MPQKRNPCSLEVIKAKTSFAHGMVVSLLSIGKALFMGYNRDTQWTKYWIMDLVEESKPTLSVMSDVVQLLRINEAQMLEQVREGFAGATPLMEWMVRSYGLPLRRAKMVMEKAVKYSEKEGEREVSYPSIQRALGEMKIDLPITEQDVERVQKPERVLSEIPSIGTPSNKRVRENITSLQKRIKVHKNWATSKRGAIEKAKELVSKLEKQLSNS
jgi:argininosuccinate lyase